MRFFLLIFLTTLSITMLIGCERQLVSPVKGFIAPPPTAEHPAQRALLNLADTAIKRGFVPFANAAADLAERVSIEAETAAQPAAFLRLAAETSVLNRAFMQIGCVIEPQKFVIALVHAAKVYATEAAVDTENLRQLLNASLEESGISLHYNFEADDLKNFLNAYPVAEPTDTKQALENLVSEAATVETVFRQFPDQSTFIPFAFGYGLNLDLDYDYAAYYGSQGPRPAYESGVILIQYDETLSQQRLVETRTAVKEFLTHKGYTIVGMESIVVELRAETIYLKEKDVDLLPIMQELINIPGVVLTQPNFFYYPQVAFPPPPLSVEIIDKVRTRYNETWCQGNFDSIDKILIEESGLDFFNYSFLSDLADIYVEENPEAAEYVLTMGFSLRSIGIVFLELYFQERLEKTHEEIMEIFRQSIKVGGVKLQNQRWIYAASIASAE